MVRRPFSQWQHAFRFVRCAAKQPSVRAICIWWVDTVMSGAVLMLRNFFFFDVFRVKCATVSFDRSSYHAPATQLENQTIYLVSVVCLPQL